MPRRPVVVAAVPRPGETARRNTSLACERFDGPGQPGTASGRGVRQRRALLPPSPAACLPSSLIRRVQRGDVCCPEGFVRRTSDMRSVHQRQVSPTVAGLAIYALATPPTVFLAGSWRRMLLVTCIAVARISAKWDTQTESGRRKQAGEPSGLLSVPVPPRGTQLCTRHCCWSRCRGQGASRALPRPQRQPWVRLHRAQKPQKPPEEVQLTGARTFAVRR